MIVDIIFFLGFGIPMGKSPVIYTMPFEKKRANAVIYLEKETLKKITSFRLIPTVILF